MAFRKAKPMQAFLKATIFGPPGSGKTFTALLLAEGLAKISGKRVAFVDTERGTDFYAQAVPERAVHPAAFEFDAIYTRSITEVNKELKSLSAAEHGVVVIDSATHLWEACKAAYQGKTNKVGQIPMWAWQKIKTPWKEMMAFVVNSPFHVFILGRQGNEFSEDEETGETKNVGVKMKAEGEAQYEPHICFRMSNELVPGKPVKGAEKIPVLHVEKDRTGILQSKAIAFPNFDKVCKPLLSVLGQEQAALQTEDEAAQQDGDNIASQDRDRERKSHDTRRVFDAEFQLASDREAVEAISKRITPDVKKDLLKEDTEALRASYLAALDRVKQSASNGKLATV